MIRKWYDRTHVVTKKGDKTLLWTHHIHTKNGEEKNGVGVWVDSEPAETLYERAEDIFNDYLVSLDHEY